MTAHECMYIYIYIYVCVCVHMYVKIVSMQNGAYLDTGHCLDGILIDTQKLSFKRWGFFG